MTSRSERARPGAPRPMGLPETARGVRWTLVLAGLVAAYVVGAGFGLAVKAAGGWESGAAWERATLAIVHATVSPALDAVMLTVPWIGTNYTLFPLVGLAAIWLWVRRRNAYALHLVVVQAGSALLNPGLKFSVIRPRPHIYPLRGQFALPSYPSGHAIAVTAVVLTAAILAHRATGATWTLWLAGAFWVLVMYSRLYLAVHWPTDVIGGILVGVIWLVVTLVAFRRVEDASR